MRQDYCEIHFFVVSRIHYRKQTETFLLPTVSSTNANPLQITVKNWNPNICLICDPHVFDINNIFYMNTIKNNLDNMILF